MSSEENLRTGLRRSYGRCLTSDAECKVVCETCMVVGEITIGGKFDNETVV